MTTFFHKFRGGGAVTSKADASPKHKKPEPDLSPLERILRYSGPIREDGSDKFYGLENFGNTCYCNSVVQALYYSESFRENVVRYSLAMPPDTPNGLSHKVPVTIRAPLQQADGSAAAAKAQQKLTSAQAMRQRQMLNGVPAPIGTPIRPEDRPNSPEYKKKQAMIKGPVLELTQEHPTPYGMDECTFTGLKDIFTVLIESNSRTGVLSPQRFLDIFKRDNENFRNSMHQDAHEFYILVLNGVIASVEANAKRLRQFEETRAGGSPAQSVEQVLAGGSASLMRKNMLAKGVTTPGAGWVHDIFEGVLTSETRCLTCETPSQRDETFLDLSIDLEEHSSVTSCLRKFSAEEMLCERNKFHCDHCGGLQEAEKRIKIKKLPRVLALHLKRFKYTDDYGHMQKLFHRVVYPYHLRMFNTTDDAEDPDRMYELYAVIVHIGGHAYHGHYVSVIKTKDRGWLLFDDEMVEPVDKHFVRNFFGDRPGQACAYVLFYQQTTFDKVREEMNAEGQGIFHGSSSEEIVVDSGPEKGRRPNGFAKTSPLPVSPVEAPEPQLLSFDHAQTLPEKVTSPVDDEVPPLPRPGFLVEKNKLAGAASLSTPNLAASSFATKQGGGSTAPAMPTRPITATTTSLLTAEQDRSKSKKEKAQERKAHKAQEKAEEKARKEARQKEKEKEQEARRQANHEKVQKPAKANNIQQAPAGEKKRKRHEPAVQTAEEATANLPNDDDAAAGTPAVNGVAHVDKYAKKDEQQPHSARSGSSFLGRSHRSIMLKNKGFSFLGRASGSSDSKASKDKAKVHSEAEGADESHAADVPRRVVDGPDALMTIPIPKPRLEESWPLPNGDKQSEVPAQSILLSSPTAPAPATAAPIPTTLSPVQEGSEDGPAEEMEAPEGPAPLETDLASPARLKKDLTSLARLETDLAGPASPARLEADLASPARPENKKHHKLAKQNPHHPRHDNHDDGLHNNNNDTSADNTDKTYHHKPSEPVSGKGQQETPPHENKGGLRDLFSFRIKRKVSTRFDSS